MAIPDQILRKPGPLSRDEQVIMREHCSRGYHILRKIPFLADASEIVYSHQEHYDGTGYPNGLRGAEIPLGARIFAVADTLDAITSDRPYRKARSFDAAREEVLRCSGTQFDPAVVEAFLKIPNVLWQALRVGISGQKRRVSTFGMCPFPVEQGPEGLGFVNRVGEVAEAAGHHPDIDIRYNKVRLALVTHDAGGLTPKDFALASQADKLA